MKRLCTICARGGSQGVVGKNIRLVAGKPLIAHSILQAKASQCFDKIIVSSDNHDILSVAKKYGVDLIIERPAQLATNTAPKLPVIRHAVTETEKQYQMQFDIIVDLDATSPLRSPEDIIGAIQLQEHTQANNVITAAPARRSPYFNLIELDADDRVILSKKLTRGIERRQDSPRCFDMNASIYVYQRSMLMNEVPLFNDHTRLYVMPEERSMDIDSELDFEWVSYLASQRQDLKS